MAPLATVYNLFWCGSLPGDQRVLEQEVRPAFPSIIPLALNVDTRWVRPPAIEAVILWPAFLTPGVCLGKDGAWVELLLLAPKASRDIPKFNAYLVNQRLKVAPGLEAGRWASNLPLFDDPKGHVEVEEVQLDRKEPLESHSAFRGIVDERFWDNLDAWKKERKDRAATKDRPPFETLYKVRVHASCLASRVGPANAEVLRRQGDPKAGPGPWFRAEYAGDELVRSVLRRMNGKGLGGQEGPGSPAGDGRGMHAFPVRPGSQLEVLDLAGIDRQQPVRAFHPVYLYPKEADAHFALGHASDLHLNSRQQLLARSPARVVHDPPGPKGEEPGTPPVGDLVNVYGDNFFHVLLGLDQAGADAVLIGGDLVDHVKNVFPFTEHYPDYQRDPGKLSSPTVKQVWDLMNLDDDGVKEKTYQHFVDHLGFYSLARAFCASSRKPMFVVTGNHDAYLEPFGISPRIPVAGKANEGIPADHNLTFYEAILAFGPSYAKVWSAQALWLHKKLFAWFHGVFTPFRDYAVDLPKQRVVGLAWGDDEEKIDVLQTGHGWGHLPRANKAVNAKALALLQKAADGDLKKVVLFTHFTFVSYKEDLPNLERGQMPDRPARGKVRTQGEFTASDVLPLVGVIKHYASYTDKDFGTFEDNRPDLYKLVHSGKLQAVFTGHSHRKGLYFLTDKASGLERQVAPGYATAMYGLRYPQTMEGRALKEARGQKRTPIVVSDSAGPVPRMNWADELYDWGSDRPAGTVLKLDAAGLPTEVVAVPAALSRARPRLGVALNYLHVMDGKKRGIEEIVSDGVVPFEADISYQGRGHHLDFTFAKEFPGSVLLTGVTLHAFPRKGGKWIHLPLGMPVPEPSKARTVRVQVEQKYRRDFRVWIGSAGVPRFLSLTFSARDPNGIVGQNYEAGARGTWHMAVTHSTKGSLSSTLFAVIEPESEIPDFAMLKSYFPEVYG